MKKKNMLNGLEFGTPEYVVAHSEWQKSKGKNPSLPFMTIKNPKRAFAVAKNYIENYSQFPEKRNDFQYEDAVLVKVKKEDDGWSFTSDGHGYLWVNKKETSIIPKVGQLVRYYFMGNHGGLGSIIRGIDFEGHHCRYKSEKQLRDEWEKQRQEEEDKKKLTFEKEKDFLDKQYKQFPTVYKQRIDKFRRNNPDFRWKYENFEIQLCRQSILVAKFVHEKLESKHIIGRIPKKEKDSYTALVEKTLNWFSKLTEKRKAFLVPGYDDSHSGNSSYCLKSLAFFYLTDQEMVVKMRGWLTPICGAEEYGDIPRHTKAA